MLAGPDEDATQPGPLGAADVVPEIVADHGHVAGGDPAPAPLTPDRVHLAHALGEERPRRLAGHERAPLGAEFEGRDVGARIEQDAVAA